MVSPELDRTAPQLPLHEQQDHTGGCEHAVDKPSSIEPGEDLEQGSLVAIGEECSEAEGERADAIEHRARLGGLQRRIDNLQWSRNGLDIAHELGQPVLDLERERLAQARRRLLAILRERTHEEVVEIAERLIGRGELVQDRIDYQDR